MRKTFGGTRTGPIGWMKITTKIWILRVWSLCDIGRPAHTHTQTNIYDKIKIDISHSWIIWFVCKNPSNFTSSALFEPSSTVGRKFLVSLWSRFQLFLPIPWFEGFSILYKYIQCYFALYNLVGKHIDLVVDRLNAINFAFTYEKTHNMLLICYCDHWSGTIKS